MSTHNPHLITQHTISCCRDCVAPKRHTACWGHCPEYLKERAEYDARKAVVDKQKKTKTDIYCQRTDSVIKANRKNGR